MDKLKNKKGYSLVEVVIALSVIIVVSATALTVILYSISLRHAEIHKSEAQNFAENVLECFVTVANDESVPVEQKSNEFERLVKFAEEAELKKVEGMPQDPIPYTYRSLVHDFVVGMTVKFSETEISRIHIEILELDGTKIVEFSYEVGRRTDV